jgi:hypothetical protein
LCVGWLICLAILAPKGTTPGKGLFGIEILSNASLHRATANQVWIREFLIKSALPNAMGLAFVIASGNEAFWALSCCFYLANSASIVYRRMVFGNEIVGTRLAPATLRLE